MAQRRQSEVELCFDSMTDLITNLAGGLILIVLLLHGVTREASSQPPPKDDPPPPKEGKQDAGAKSMEPLLKRVNLLRSEVKRVEDNVKELENRLPQVKREIEELLKKVDGIEPPKSPPKPQEENKQARQVEYRPPLRRDTKKAPNIAFVCQKGRLFIVDLEAIGTMYKEKVKTADDLKVGLTITPLGGDYEAKIVNVITVPLGNQILHEPTIELLPKNGAHGEPLDQLRQGSSAYLSFLSKLAPSNSYLQFTVFPDSYEVFRQARDMAWHRKFDLNWFPLAVGESIKLGGGSGSIQ